MNNVYTAMWKIGSGLMKKKKNIQEIHNQYIAKITLDV